MVSKMMFSIYLVHWINKLLEKNKSRSSSTVRMKWQPQLIDASKEKDNEKWERVREKIVLFFWNK